MYGLGEVVGCLSRVATWAGHTASIGSRIVVARALLAARAVASSPETEGAVRRSTARVLAVRITTPRRCRMLPTAADSSVPERSAKLFAIFLSVRRAPEAQAPEGSNTVGVKQMHWRSQKSVWMKELSNIVSLFGFYTKKLHILYSVIPRSKFPNPSQNISKYILI